MIYIIGDDTGGNDQKYYVSYMIYEEGAGWLRQNIKSAVDAVSRITGEFSRFHFRELINSFQVKKREYYNTIDGKLCNSKESVIEGVVTTFVDLFEQLLKNNIILPKLVVSKLSDTSWKQELDKNILFSLSNSKKDETLLPLLNAHQCMKLLKPYGIDEELCFISDLSGNCEKDIVYKTPLNGNEEIKIRFQSSKEDPLLQMADFLAYSYNRFKKQDSGDIFNRHTRSIVKYYEEI